MNPFLPLNEYVPDGEPHVFGDRVYLYGSHDKEGGYTFCMLDYVCYSAPVNDLSNWRYEGIIYRANQDPQYSPLSLEEIEKDPQNPAKQHMYAPDVVQGNDGKYYLYYSMSGNFGKGGYYGPMSVAVCDEPAGKYEFLGFVQNPDGTSLDRYILFDPAVINDNGVIRLYYGTQYLYEEEDDYALNPKYMRSEVEMFGRSEAEIKSYEDSIMGPVMAVLCDDMITVKEMPRHIIPCHVKGTDFEEHPFFEAASMRKVNLPEIGEKYYFIYSSKKNHELCYAMSDYPDKDFVFGGTIVSNGDIGLNGKSDADKLNMTGTTHGSIIKILDDWYVFYHRLTHKSDYSRQACAEKIKILSDGTIPQIAITSMGPEACPLKTGIKYPAVIACNLTNGHMPHGSNRIYTIEFPNVNHKNDERFIEEIEHGTLIGYKYFECKNVEHLLLSVRADLPENKAGLEGPLRPDKRPVNIENPDNNFASKDSQKTDECYFEIRLSERGDIVGRINIPEAVFGVATDNAVGQWHVVCENIKIPDGIHPIYLVYHGNKKVQLKDICFKK